MNRDKLKDFGKQVLYAALSAALSYAVAHAADLGDGGTVVGVVLGYAAKFLHGLTGTPPTVLPVAELHDDQGDQ